MSEMSTWELAEGAKINFENVVKMNPTLGHHPHFMIAMEQLANLCERLEKELDGEQRKGRAMKIELTEHCSRCGKDVKMTVSMSVPGMSETPKLCMKCWQARLKAIPKEIAQAECDRQNRKEM